MQDHEINEDQPDLTPRDARSGVISGRVIRVLIWSFLLAVILVGGATFLWTTTH